VKGNRRKTKALVKHRGKQMLPGVLLHVVKAPAPVHATGNRARI